MTEETKPKNVYQRINAIMLDLGAIDKGSKAPGAAGGFDYVSYDALMARVQPLLVRHGVGIEVAELEYERWETVNKQGQPSGSMTNQRVAVWWVNIDDPADRAQDIVRANGHDSLDKGPGKSLTYAVKQATLKRFAVPCGQDIEAHASDEPHQQAAPAPQAEEPSATPTRGEMASEMMRWVDEMGLDSADLTDMCQHAEKTGFSQMPEHAQVKTHRLVCEMHQRYCDLVPQGKSPDLRAQATGDKSERLNGYPMRAGLAEWGAMIECAVKGEK